MAESRFTKLILSAPTLAVAGAQVLVRSFIESYAVGGTNIWLTVTANGESVVDTVLSFSESGEAQYVDYILVMPDYDVSIVSTAHIYYQNKWQQDTQEAAAIQFQPQESDTMSSMMEFMVVMMVMNMMMEMMKGAFSGTGEANTQVGGYGTFEYYEDRGMMRWDPLRSCWACSESNQCIGRSRDEVVSWFRNRPLGRRRDYE